MEVVHNDSLVVVFNGGNLKDDTKDFVSSEDILGGDLIYGYCGGISDGYYEKKSRD